MRKLESSTKQFVWALSALYLLFGAGTLAFAKDKEKDKPKAVTKAKDVEKDPYAVPVDASPDELFKFITTQKRRKSAKSATEFYTNLTKAQSAILKACELILANDKTNEEQEVAAIKAKFSALGLMAQLTRYGHGDKQAAAQTLVFAKLLSKDERPEIAELANTQIMIGRTATVGSLSKDDKASLIADVAEFLSKNANRERLSVARGLAKNLERSGQTDLAIVAYSAFAKALVDAKDPTVKRYGPKMEGSVRRLQLPGNVMQVHGTTDKGEEFDWASYRGKVVLVDFWASWCGPCVRELPNVKENYAKYRSLGFEVVGINMDRTKVAMDRFIEKQELPWTNLFSTDPKTRYWDAPMATYYGVMSIPTAILVDKEGKVVSMRARGSVLSQKLEELLGPAPKASESAKSSSDGDN